MKQPIHYSALLQEFIQPFIAADETENTFFEKCTTASLIWNYYIADKFELEMASAIKEAAVAKNESNPKLALPFAKLLERKKAFYDEHNYMIVNVEMIPKPDGSTSLKAYTVPHDKIEEFMSGLSDYMLPDA